MISFDRPLPNDLDAERSLLCACMLDTRSLSESIDLLSPDDFYSDKHQKIYKALSECCPKNDSTQPEIAVVASKLKSEGIPLSDLLALQETPMAVDISTIAKIIKEKSVVRKAIAVSLAGIADLIKSNGDAGEVLDCYQQKILKLEMSNSQEEATPISEIVSCNIDKYEMASTRGGITGAPSGFNDLDFIIGGFHPSDFIILAARPGMGKTALAMNIAENCGVPAICFSLEMAKSQLVDRILSGKSKINLTKIINGRLNGQDWERLSSAADSVSALPVLIDDSPALHYSEIRRRTRAAYKKHGIGIVIIDYLQLMRGDGDKKNRENEISSISRALKAIAKELQIPVIALAQLNRELEKRSNKRPELSDLRESGQIEQDADVVLFIYREEHYVKGNVPADLNGKAEIIVAKHRNGPTGFTTLRFDKETTTFRNIYRDHK